MNMNRKFGIKLFLGLAFKSLIILFLTSCEEKGQPTPIVRLETNNSSINLSSFVSKVEYISLKTDDRNPIGTIVTIEFFNNLIFIKHTPRSPRLSVFSTTGEHLYNIGKLGRGPEEYAHMKDFTIDKINNQVLIMDLVKQKIHFYGMDGTFLKSEDPPVLGLGFRFINDELLFYLGNLYNDQLNASESEFYNLVVTDTQLREKRRFLKVPNKFKGCIQGSAPSSLSCYENTISITQPLSNIIYCYKNGSLESRFEIDFGALACDFDAERDLYTGNPSTFAPYLRTRGYSLPPSRFFEFKNLIYFDFKSVDETYFVFLDKASGVTHIGNELVDDVDHGIFGLPIASWDEKLVTIIEPMDLLDRPILPQGLIGKELDELSNPILALHTLREAILISSED